eukprot:1048794-Rhodomonas_salina.1
MRCERASGCLVLPDTVCVCACVRACVRGKREGRGKRKGCGKREESCVCACVCVCGTRGGGRRREA